MKCAASIGWVFFASTSLLWADSWPSFRGAEGTGVSKETTSFPTKWSTDSGVAWKVDLPGRGNSSPAVIGDRLYVTAHLEDATLQVLCLKRSDGSLLWKKAIGQGKMKTFGPENLYAHRHNAATPSPTANETHVWALFGTGDLACLSRDGKVVWQKNLVKEYGPYQVRFGYASSPRLWGDRLFVTCLQKGDSSYVAAFEAKSGTVVWKKDRNLPAEDDGPDAYSSPVILKTPKRVELVVSGSDHINAYRVSDGEQLWIASGLKIKSEYGRVIASPAISEGVIVACSANPPNAPGHAIAIRTGGKGDISQSHRLWDYSPFTADSPTPVCYKGRLYMIRDDGIASILDLKSGKSLWRERLAEGPFRGSTVAGDGKVYFVNRDGLCVVMEAGTDGKVLAKNRVDGKFFSTPALSDGVLYLRAHKKLYAIGGS